MACPPRSSCWSTFHRLYGEPFLIFIRVDARDVFCNSVVFCQLLDTLCLSVFFSKCRLLVINFCQRQRNRDVSPLKTIQDREWMPDSIWHHRCTDCIAVSKTMEKTFEGMPFSKLTSYSHDAPGLPLKWDWIWSRSAIWRTSTSTTSEASHPFQDLGYSEIVYFGALLSLPLGL